MSVRERIDAALKLARRDNPRARISVSELSRLADVSRANLYASHRDVLANLRSEPNVTRPRRHSADASEELKQIRMELQEEVRKSRALTYLVIELRAELQRIQGQLSGQKFAKNARHRRS